MDKYLQYNHLELADDPSFIRWVKGSTPRDDQDWEAWLVDYPEKENVVAQAKEMVLAMKFVDDKPSLKLENEIWSEISADIKAKPRSILNPKPKGLIRLLPYVAVAAVALILLLKILDHLFSCQQCNQNTCCRFLNLFY